MEDNRLSRWERRTELPLSAAALLFLVAYGVPILVVDLPAGWGRFWDAVVIVTWSAFLIDYVIRFAIAPRRGAFLRHHLFDLVVIALPLLRPLRVLRLISVVTLFGRRAGGGLRGRVGLGVAVAATLLGIAASLAILDAERDIPDSMISTFPDALWWSLATMTTVGYGDLYPVSMPGRLIAAFLMVGGIALLGVVTGTVASWFVDRFSESKADEAVTQAELAALTEEVRALRAELRRLDPAREGRRNPDTAMGGRP
jgi:voltage-gated potassium channel